MNNKNLLKYMCPNCNKNLEIIKHNITCDCGFEISEVDFDFEKTLIENKTEDYHIPDVDENLELLNNL